MKRKQDIPTTNLNDLARVLGKERDFSKYGKEKKIVDKRVFKDEKGIFREMSDKLGKGKIIVAD